MTPLNWLIAFCNPAVQPAFHLVGRPFQNFFQQFALGRIKFSQHIIGDLAARRPARPIPIRNRANSRERQMLLDGLQSVMSTAAAARAQPDFAKRQIRVVHRHQQLLQRQLIKIRQRTDRFAAQIHERLRLAEQNPFALSLRPWPRAPRTFFSFVQSPFHCAASFSTSKKPALCRVFAYSAPGFPKPTMRCIGSMRGESGSRRQNYFFFSALASGLASAFLSPAAAAFASPLAGRFFAGFRGRRLPRLLPSFPWSSRHRRRPERLRWPPLLPRRAARRRRRRKCACRPEFQRPPAP